MPRKNIYITEEQNQILKQNPDVIKQAIKNAIELSIGCITSNLESYIVKGRDYEIIILKTKKIIILKSEIETKPVNFHDFETKHFKKLQEFVKQNPTYSHNLIYKFNNILSNDEN